MGASLVPGVFATGGGDATVKVWAPAARIPQDNDGSCNEELAARRHNWECVGGIQGTVGAVSTILMTEDTLNFGTSQAILASFPLQSCMKFGNASPSDRIG